MSKKKTLADLMDNDFFIDFDNTEEKVERKRLAESLKHKRTLTESAKENVKEPDNAVVPCKVNKVIAHCEDEKPIDCLGEKKPLEKPLTEEPDRVELKEARSIDEIKAEIEKLQQELADAMAAEKKASYSIPEVVYVWDIYLELHEKGNWTSAEEEAGTWEGTVFETAEDAKNAAWLHLKELEDEGKLEYESSAYYIDAFDVPLNIVSDETLSFSGLDHLIA